MAQDAKNVKKRNWAFVAYPENMPTNWLEILQETGAPIAISPLHDKDLNADEHEKKAHYHVICCWDGPVRFTQAEKLAKSVNGTIPIPLESIRGYYRYFTHKDNPEKHQYDESEIKCLNGFAITDFVELSKSEVVKIKYDILDLIEKNGFCEYYDLIEFLKNDNIERLEIAMNNTLFFNTYLKSKRHKGLKNGIS